MKKEFVVSRQGKDFCLYAGLLDQAHQEGLKRITTTVIQMPSKDNGMFAVCHAEVETTKGVFSGIGDASPENVGKMIVPHLLRMSETRAKARALRDAINVGVPSFEELGAKGESEDDEDEPERPALQVVKPAPAAKPAPPTPADAVAVLYERLLKAQRAIFDITGQSPEVAEGMNAAQATNRLASLTAQYQQLVKEKKAHAQ